MWWRESLHISHDTFQILCDELQPHRQAQTSVCELVIDTCEAITHHLMLKSIHIPKNESFMGYSRLISMTVVVSIGSWSNGPVACKAIGIY